MPGNQVVNGILCSAEPPSVGNSTFSLGGRSLVETILATLEEVASDTQEDAMVINAELGLSPSYLTIIHVA